MSKKFSVIMTMLLISFTLFAGGGKESGSQAGKDDIVIGLTIPLTGDYAIGGLRITQGAQLAVKEINDAGGILGRKLRLQIEDSQAQSDKDIQMVNKLASDGVVAIVGPYFSGTTIAIAQTLESNGIMCINGSTSPSVRALNSPWIFRPRSTDDINMQILAKAAIDGNAKKPAIFCVNDETGTVAGNIMKAYLEEAGIPYYYEGHNPTDVDMSTSLSRSVSQGCDAYIIVTHNNAAAIFARQMYEMEIKKPVYGSMIFAQSDVLAMMEPEWVEGWKAACDFSYLDQRPVQKEYTEKFRNAYGDVPEIQAAVYYGCIKVLADAIKRAGSTDRKAIRDAVAQTEGLAVPVGTVMATADQYTNMIFEMGLAEIRNCEPVIIGSVSLLK
jgi:branched-chain amino acid transport system substrate-binding protein